MESKKKSDFSSSYKMKSGTIDKRSLRLHRRSLEWKNQRQEENNKRRNLEDLSPLQEIDNNVPSTSDRKQDDTPKRASSSKKGSKPGKKGDERRERLMKWKQEKELKKKLEAQEKNKKNPVFKVSGSLHTDLSVYKDVKFPALKQATAQKPSAKGSGASPGHTNLSSNAGSSKSSLSSRAPLKNSASKTKAPALPPAPPVTSGRGKKAAAAPSPAAPAKPKARSKSTVNVFQRLAQPKSQGKRSAKKDQSAEKGRMRGPASSSLHQIRGASASESRSKQNSSKGKPKTPTRRVTRQTTQAQKATEETADGNSSNNTSVHLPGIEKRDNQFNVNLNKVSTSRGESFAEPDFLFSAPSSVPSFAFQPLSPASASRFLGSNQGTTESLLFDNPQGGRCSTPVSGKNQGSGASSGSETSGSPVRSAVEPGITGVPNCPRSTRRSLHRRTSSGRMIVEEPLTTCIPGCVEETVVDLPESSEERMRNRLGSPAAGNSYLEYFGKRRSLQETSEGFSSIPNRRSLRRSLRLASLAESEFQNQNTVTPLGNRIETDCSASAAEPAVPGSLGGTTDALTSLPSVGTKTPVRVTFQSPSKAVTEVPMECDDADSLAVKDTISAEDCVSRPAGDVDTPVARETQGRSLRSRKSLPAADGFVTPGQPLSARRSTKKRRKTDLVQGQKALSPEEWVEILSKSPMVEMTRRTPRKTSPEVAQKIQPLNFDDIEEELEKSRIEMEANTSTTKETENALGNALGTAQEAQEEKENVPEAGTCMAVPPSPSSQRNVPFFRALLVSETYRLTSLCTHWQDVNSNTPDIPENARGMIRTTVGQAQLLMAQRFQQFSGLVDDCEFHRGERETTTTDLQGFWDMVFYQVEDVDAKFKELEQLQQDGWVVKTPEAKAGTSRPAKKKKAGRPNPKPAGKSKFAAFREQMRKKREEEEAAEAASAENAAEVVPVSSTAVPEVPVPSPVPEEKQRAMPEPMMTTAAVEERMKEPAEQQPPLPSGSGEAQGGPTPFPFISLTPSIVFMEQTPRRKSYVPAVPSPLLVDSTPKEVSTPELESSPSVAFSKLSLLPKAKEPMRSGAPRRRLSHLSWVTDSPITELEGPSGPENRGATSSPPQAGSRSQPSTTAAPLGSPGSPSRTQAELQPASSDASTGSGKPRSSSRGGSGRSTTAQRRSLRQRKSMGLLKEVEERLEEEMEEGRAPTPRASPVDFERYLKPTQPAAHYEPSIPFSASPQKKKGKGRKGSLRSADKFASNNSSVHFDPQVVDSPQGGGRLPATPFNYNSLKPRPRVSTEPVLFSPEMEAAKGSGGSSGAREQEDMLIDMPPVDTPRLGSSQTPSRRSLRPRPSLLYTPDKKDSYDAAGQDLMTFSP